MQATTTFTMQPTDKNLNLSKSPAMYSQGKQPKTPQLDYFQQNSLPIPLLNVSNNPKNFFHSPAQQNDLGFPVKMIKANNGTGHVAPRATVNFPKHHALNIKVPVAMKPSTQPQPFKQNMAVEERNQITQNNFGLDSALNQEILFNQNLSIPNQLDSSLNEWGFLLNQINNQGFKQETQGFGKQIQEIAASQYLNYNNNVMNLLNLQCFEMMYQQLDQEFKEIVDKFKLQQQQQQNSKPPANRDGKPGSLATSKDSRNLWKENVLEIKTKESNQIENKNDIIGTPAAAVIGSQREASYFGQSENIISQSALPEDKNLTDRSDDSSDVYMLSEEEKYQVSKDSPVEKENQSMETEPKNRKRVIKRKLIDTVVLTREPISQKRPTNKWQAIKILQEELTTEPEKPYVIAIHYDPSDMSQKVKETPVGPDHQAVVTKFSINKNMMNKKTLKQRWNPEVIDRETLERYLGEMSEAIDGPIHNEEKAIRVLMKFKMNIGETIDHIKKNYAFYKNNFKLDQRTLRNRESTFKVPSFGP